MGLHREAALGDRHAPANWEYADATARGAATGFVAGDVGKLARQLSDNSLWMLTDESPIAWAQVGGVGIAGSITVEEGNVSEGTATSLDFDDSDFTIGLAAGEAEIALNYGTGAGQPAEGNHTHAGGVSNLDDLADVNAAAPSDGDVLTWDATPGEWVASAPAGGGGGSGAEGRLTRREMQVLKNPGATTLSTLGFASAPGTAGTLASADDADGPWATMPTNGVINNVAGMIPAMILWRRDWEPDLLYRLKTGPDVTNLRYWIGMFSAAPDASATPAVTYAAFRYDTAADGTAFWRCASDNGSGTPEVTTTAVAVAVDTAYTFRIHCDGSDVLFYLDGTLVATHSTTIPAATTLMGHRAVVTALAAAVKSLKFGRLAAWHL
jgi:hypothetical protein